MANDILENKLLGESNLEVIESYLVSEPGAVTLTDKQQELLARWSYADELIRKSEMRRETIAQMICRKFDVGRHSAYQDIVNAEKVFASSTPLNKKYRIQIRIEFIEMKINELYAGVQYEAEDPKEEDVLEKVARIACNKEYIQEAIMLEKVLERYYKQYPDLVQPRSPKNIIFNIQHNHLPAAPMTVAEAIKKATIRINLKANPSNGQQGDPVS
jgi:hypothetical protein